MNLTFKDKEHVFESLMKDEENEFFKWTNDWVMRVVMEGKQKGLQFENWSELDDYIITELIDSDGLFQDLKENLVSMRTFRCEVGIIQEITECFSTLWLLQSYML